jgi:LPXTG-motif cell wall-anchored protein
MRRRVIGAMLTVLGVLLVLFEPIVVVNECVDFVNGRAGYCRNQGASDWWGLISYPTGWEKLTWPMLIIGVALVVTGIVLLVKRRRSRGSPGTAT